MNITLRQFVCKFCTVQLLAVLFTLLSMQETVGAEVPDGKYIGIVKETADRTVADLVGLGDSCLAKGLKDEAMVYYMVAGTRLREDMPDAERGQVAIAYLKRGNVFYLEGGYAGALDAYVTGLKIYEGCKNQREIGRFYNNIGNIYCLFRDYEKGLGYYDTGYKYCRKYGDRLNGYKVLVNMTGICTFIGDIAKARAYYAKAESMKDGGDKEACFMSTYNLGLILAAEGDGRKALACFRKAADYAEANRVGGRYLCSAYQQTYRAYMRLGMADSTEHYLLLCERKAVEEGVMHHFIDILNDRAQFCDGRGDFRRANKYRAQYIREYDSVFNVREFDVARNAQFLYEVGKTDRRIKALNERERERLATIRSQRRAISAVTCVALVVGLLLAVVYRQKKRLDKSYADLYAVNRDFAETHERMRQRLRLVGERLDAAEADNERLAQAAGGEGGARRKYSSSNLDDDGRQRLAEAVAGVMENTLEFCSTDFSLDRLAALVGSNSKYVSQVINDVYNKNFSNYVNEYRVRLACLRLADGKKYGMYTLNSIAESVGFKSYSTFVAVFRKVTGITPSMYKEKAEAGL